MILDYLKGCIANLIPLENFSYFLVYKLVFIHFYSCVLLCSKVVQQAVADPGFVPTDICPIPQTWTFYCELLKFIGFNIVGANTIYAMARTSLLYLFF